MRNHKTKYLISSTSTWECEDGDFTYLYHQMITLYNAQIHHDSSNKSKKNKSSKDNTSNDTDSTINGLQEEHDEANDVIKESSIQQQQNNSPNKNSVEPALSHGSPRKRRASAVSGEFYRRASMQDSEWDRPAKEQSKKLTQLKSVPTVAKVALERKVREKTLHTVGVGTPEMPIYKQDSDTRVLLRCDLCSKSYFSVIGLKQHQRLHSDPESLKCRFCGKLLSNKTAVKRHESIHTGLKPFKCSYCEKTFAVQYRCKNHEATHDESKRVVCSTCGKSFTCMGDLRIHKKVKHTLEGYPYKCDVCGLGFLSEKKLKDHGNIHSGETPYECHICHKKYPTKQGLTDHRKSHIPINKRPFKCEVCGYRFLLESILTKHMKIHAPEVQRKEKHSSAAFPYKCDVCNKGFLTENHWKDHGSSFKGETPYQCGICIKKFKWKECLDVHRKSHDPVNETQQTNKSLEDESSSAVLGNTGIKKGTKHWINEGASGSNLSKQNKETGVVFHCDICSKFYYSVPGFRNHQRWHSDQASLKCTICGQVLSTAAALKFHEELHTNEMEYKCKTCGKGFRTLRYLKRHQKIHGRPHGEKPHKSHRKNREPYAGPYKCAYCEETFTVQTRRNIHESTCF